MPSAELARAGAQPDLRHPGHSGHWTRSAATARGRAAENLWVATEGGDGAELEKPCWEATQGHADDAADSGRRRRWPGPSCCCHAGAAVAPQAVCVPLVRDL